MNQRRTYKCIWFWYYDRSRKPQGNKFR